MSANREAAGQGRRFPLAEIPHPPYARAVCTQWPGGAIPDGKDREVTFGSTSRGASVCAGCLPRGSHFPPLNPCK